MTEGLEQCAFCDARGWVKLSGHPRAWGHRDDCLQGRVKRALTKAMNVYVNHDADMIRYGDLRAIAAAADEHARHCGLCVDVFCSRYGELEDRVKELINAEG